MHNYSRIFNPVPQLAMTKLDVVRLRPWPFVAWTTLALGCLLIAACGNDNQQRLTAAQVQSWAFVTGETILDLRRPGPDAPDLMPPWTQVDRIVLGQRWSKTDAGDIATLGNQSTVRIRLDIGGDWDLYLSAKPSEDQEFDGDPILRFIVNTREAGRLELDTQWADYRVPLEPETLRPGWNRIILSGSPGSAEPWPIRIRAIGLVPSGASIPSGPAVEFDGRTGTFRANRSGKLFVPLRPPEVVASVAFSLSAWSVPWANPVTVRATLVPVGRASDPIVVADEPVRGSYGLGAARLSAEVALGSRGLTPGCLVFEIDPANSWNSAEIEWLDWKSDSTAFTPTNAGYLPPSSPDDLPDIVLIILDAARADHFGTYGYDRDTTPHMDTLAAESAVFSQAFALAPYTRASVATLITGLTIQDHDVVDQTHVLDTEATTLAEYLQSIGYRTVCYSASPQNSVASGSHQGCDVFREVWVGATREEWIDPHHLSELAREELTRESEQALFLMLHYVPPHDPYAPRAEFDIFGDEGYTGDFDGTLTTIRGINDGILNPSAADLEKIVSLYDGNLRMADDAVGKVLDTLRRRARWNDTIVLVLSDHGEAFAEHGRMGHNSTVYDEMLHVPLIIRLGDSIPEYVDTNALVTLADVVPTVLGRVGIQIPDALVGSDLFASNTFALERSLVARTAGKRPWFAYRTTAWKMIANDQDLRNWKVYNLEADPEETENLASESLDTALCLAALLRDGMTESRLQLAGGEVSELSSEDEKALRSLGYIR